MEERAYFYGHKIRDRSLFSKERLFSGRGGPLCLGGGCFLSSTLGKVIKKKSLRGGLRVFEIISIYHQSHVPRDVLIWITLPCEF